MTQDTVSPSRPLRVPQGRVPVYFIGLHHLMSDRPPVFVVKKNTYAAPTIVDPVTGKRKLHIGGTVLVNENDVAELLSKTKANIPGVGVAHTFTDNAQFADQVRRLYEQGHVTPISGEMTLAEAKHLLTPEQLAERVANEMSEDELARLLEEKRSKKGKHPNTLPPLIQPEDE